MHARPHSSPRMPAARCPALARQLAQQRAPVRRPEPGAGVPAGPRRVLAVVALRDVVEAGAPEQRIQPRLREPDRRPELLVESRDQPGPQRRDGARAADRLVGAVDPDRVAGLRVGIAADVGNATTRLVAVDVVGNLGGRLVARERELAADAAAGGAVAGIVPDRLGADRRARGGRGSCRRTRARVAPRRGSRRAARRP